ncbi:MFS transporter [Dactylosporangium sp. CA-233914]|uniref:MFS transporter n=1 Tax=Dactylosporangium sp. CA-233914 TaxID=3239934 RepID=UPI003D8E1EB6
MDASIDETATPLRADPLWRRYLLARSVSWAGSTMTLVALPLMVFQHTGSPALTAALAAVESVPYLVFGLLAGALADRWDRRRTLVATSLAQALLLGGIPAAAVLDVLTPAHVFVAAAGSGIAAVFFDAASFAVLPALVGGRRIARATASSVSAYTVIGLAGPAVAGLIATAAGPATAIGLDALSFAAAAALLARLPLARLSALAAPPPGPRRRLGAEIREGLAFVRHHPAVRSYTLLGIGNSLTGGAVLGLIVVVAVDRLGLAAHDWRVGLCYVAACAGTLVANTALPRLRARMPAGWITLAGLAANWLALLAWAGATRLGPALAALLLWQATNSLVSVNGIVARQQAAPDHLQGRVNATARMIAWGGQPLGAALGGMIAEAAGVRIALLAAGCAVLAAAVAGWATPLRHRTSPS